MEDKEIKGKQVLPLLALRDMVVFPHQVAPLFVGREKSLKALEIADKKKNLLMLVTQKDSAENDPQESDVFEIGVLAHVLQILKLPDGTMKVLVEGISRARLLTQEERDGAMFAEVERIKDVSGDDKKLEILSKSILQRFSMHAGLKKKMSAEAVIAIGEVKDISKRTDMMAAQIAEGVEDRQELVKTNNIVGRLEALYILMEKDISMIKLEKKIRGRVKNQMEKTQREYYLNEQLKAIQNELGDGENATTDIEDFKKKIKATKLSKQAKEKALQELKKLKQMNAMSAESVVVRNYLDWLLSIPWGESAPLKEDLVKAQQGLDDDHYGLEKVKERILEYLAVQKRAGKLRGPILCLVGPPGVGKTSLGKSIATATGRQFVRMSLGGVRDEAEIRGHRRTYIGSQPGRIIQSMKKTKFSNPLFLLDEIDKIGADYRGDPAAALLEVLDPEQNSTFADHYLEVDYDLSNIMFVTTANTLDIPPALLDRMEIIRIAGYTEDEKIEIARRHLIPKILKSHKLSKEEWSLDDESLKVLIKLYTREAGVRSLEREISSLARKAVKSLLTEENVTKISINKEKLYEMLGVPKFVDEELEKENRVGVVTGMAWTQYGGELLTIESALTHGQGNLIITGNLRDVMKESISAAKTFVRSRAVSFGVEPSLFARRDIHIHLPEAATPKDGPSAGVALVAAIVSLATNIPARRDVAMTGEITLRGRVLPIGGLKEKMLAAMRAGVTKVLIPAANAKDLPDIPEKVKARLEIVEIKYVDEIFPHVLTRMPKPIMWADEGESPPPAKKPEIVEDLTTH